MIIVDTEYTTWPGALESGWAGPGQHREIVQLSAIKVDENFRELDALDILIKPAINGTLSELFTQLTTITQERLDNEGTSFQAGLKKFLDFCENGALPVICMNADEAVFRENCRLGNIPFPFPRSWHRLRPFLETQGVDTGKHASGDLHTLTDTPLTGHTHNALHDDRSMACWLSYAQKRGRFTSLADLPTGAPTTDPRSNRGKPGAKPVIE